MLKLERPTEPLAWWEGETILGGKDALGGGTWLGSTRDGRIAFLTNFREVEMLSNPKTRGDLPLRFLQVITHSRCLLLCFLLVKNQAAFFTFNFFGEFFFIKLIWCILL